jgi:hypothetical protein
MDDDVLDSIKTESQQEPVYLKKAIRVFWVYFALLIIVLFCTYLANLSSRGEINIPEAIINVAGLILAVPFLAFVILVPIGLFYIVKSFKGKEARLGTRILYTIIHSFFCVMVVIMLWILVSDVSKLF